MKSIINIKIRNTKCKKLISFGTVTKYNCYTTEMKTREGWVEDFYFTYEPYESLLLPYKIDNMHVMFYKNFVNNLYY